MKFPSLSATLKLLKPFNKIEPKKQINDDELTLYDKIEEIVSIATVHSESLEIVVKFYELTPIQQQLALVALVEHNMFETLKVILKTGFELNFLIRGQTPLHFAISNRNLNIIRVLISFDADLELKNNFKETALNLAVRVGDIDVIKCLLEYGAMVNTQSSDSTTPLEYAIHNGDMKSVDLLEQYGASLSSSYL